MKKNAFVTGGTGFLGINLIEQLLTDGWQVTALHRPNADLTYLKRFRVALIEGAIDDKASLEKAMPVNLDAVFHVAGDTNMWKKHNERQTRCNVAGTRNLVEVAINKKARCFIHTSSISAWGPVSGLIDEQTPQQGSTSLVNYEKTKWAGEQEALKAMQSGMKVVVMNPATIVGPYDKNTWGRAFFSLLKGEVPLTPSGNTSIVHVHEVVKAHIASVDKGQNGHNYILGGINSSFPEFFGEIAALLGKKLPTIASPGLFKGLATLLEFGARFTQKEPPVTPELAEITSRKDYRFSSEKAQRELGLCNIPIKTCVNDNYQWLINEGLLQH